MICPNCKSSIFDNSKFCPVCRNRFVKEQEAPIIQESAKSAATKYCPLCNKEYDSDKMYCNDCGSKLMYGNKTVNTAPQPYIPTPPNIPTPSHTPTQPNIPTPPSIPTQTTHHHIFKSEMISFYEGEPKLSLTKFSGYADVYDDSIEFEIKLGNSGAAMFGPIGMMIAANQVKENNLVTPINNIKGLKFTRYIGIMKMLTVELENGSSFSLTSYFGTSRPLEELADILHGITNIEIR